MENNDKIDQFFKESFEKLPSHATGKWDKPSVKVWANIEAQIHQPAQAIKGNAGSNNWLLWAVAGLISVLAVLGIWYQFQPKQSTLPATTQPPVQAQPVIPVMQEQPNTLIHQEQATEKEATKSEQKKKAPKPAIEESKPTFRNNIEKSRAEEKQK